MLLQLVLWLRLLRLSVLLNYYRCSNWQCLVTAAGTGVRRSIQFGRLVVEPRGRLLRGVRWRPSDL